MVVGGKRSNFQGINEYKFNKSQEKRYILLFCKPVSFVAKIAKGCPKNIASVVNVSSCSY